MTTSARSLRRCIALFLYAGMAGCSDGVGGLDSLGVRDGGPSSSADLGGVGGIDAADLGGSRDAVVPVPVCGDAVKEGDEVCDGAALGGADCRTYGYESGALGCLPSCQGHDVSACTGIGDPAAFGADDGAFDCGLDEAFVDDACRPLCPGQGPRDGATVEVVADLDTPVAVPMTSFRFGLDWEAEPDELGPDFSFGWFVLEGASLNGASQRHVIPIVTPGPNDVEGVAEGTVPSGTYTVVYRPPRSCGGCTRLREYSTALAEAFVLEGGGVVEARFAFPETASWTVDATVDGRAAGADLVMRLNDLASGASRVARPGDTFVVPKGTHTVEFVEVPFIPNPRILRGVETVVEVQEDQSTFLDIPVHALSGTAMVGPLAPPPGSSIDLRALFGEGRSVRVPLQEDGAFSVDLPEGRYRVEWRETDFEQIIDLTEDLRIELELPIPEELQGLGFVDVSGTVRSNIPLGRFLLAYRPGEGTVLTGRLLLRPIQTGVWAFEGEVLEGSTVFFLQVNRTYTELERRVVSRAGPLQLELEVGEVVPVRIEGRLWLDGREPYPEDDFSGRLGRLRFTCLEDCVYRGRQLVQAETGGRIDVDLINAGVYRVELEVENALPGSPVPVGRHLLHPGLRVEPGLTRRDFDIKTFELDVEVDFSPGLRRENLSFSLSQVLEPGPRGRTEIVYAVQFPGDEGRFSRSFSVPPGGYQVQVSDPSDRVGFTVRRRSADDLALRIEEPIKEFVLDVEFPRFSATTGVLVRERPGLPPERTNFSTSALPASFDYVDRGSEVSVEFNGRSFPVFSSCSAAP